MRGKLFNMHKLLKYVQDHPRVCGENSANCVEVRLLIGSPPRMRGKQGFPFPSCARRRITPAYAGKTFVRYVRVVGFKDHPRVCGENSPSRIGLTTSNGSPPRMRGKRFFLPAAQTGKRITPAYAGKTRLQRRINMPNEDHPRRCGENVYLRLYYRRYVGSPPQVRGKRRYSTFRRQR